MRRAGNRAGDPLGAGRWRHAARRLTLPGPPGLASPRLTLTNGADEPGKRRNLPERTGGEAGRGSLAEPIAYHVEDGVAVLGLVAAPGAGLTAELHEALVAALDRAAADEEVRALVLAGFQGTMGDPLRLADAEWLDQARRLRDLCARIEDGARPVVAALDGPALGGMLELALAAHGRVAGPGTRIGLPDVALGLLPMAGATQRLPRLAGIRAALETLLSRRPFAVTDPLAAGIVDRVAEGPVMPAALVFARDLAGELAGQGGTPRRNRDLPVGVEDPLGYQTEIAAARDRLEATPDEAPRAILRAVEAAQLLPFETGLEFEIDEAEQALKGDQSAALRHLLRAERQCWRRPDFATDPASAPARIGSVGLVGGGVLATELAVVCLDAGLQVTLHARDDRSGAALTGSVATIYDRAVERSRLSPEERAARLGRLSTGTDLDAAAAADLVVETTGADPEARGILLERLGRAAHGQAVLATTGPSAALERIAEASGRAGRVLALRLLRPAHVKRLVEVAAHPGTEATALQALAQMLLGGRRIVLHSAPRDLPLGEEMRLARHYAALGLIESGVAPTRLQTAVAAAGLGDSLLAEIDAAGLPTLKARIEAADLPVPSCVETMIEAGREGRATGRGFLLWPEGEAPLPDPAVDALLAARRPSREMPASGIAALIVAATANRGTRLVREEQAQWPGDLDVASVYNQSFPRLSGGPMQAADRQGLFEMQRALDHFIAEHAPVSAAPFWQPDPLLQELIRNGRHFADLDRVAPPDWPPPELP
ncbi:hypothetical protein E0K89_015135 [Aquicoccus sp. SCR17]|nr:hypothetical protein [Carideicomes alvinocaridis]